MATHITYADAASRLSVTVRTIGRMVARGDLDIIGQGNGRRVSIASVDEALRYHGASRTAARMIAEVCSPHEFEEAERFLLDLLARLRRSAAPLIARSSHAKEIFA